MVWRIGWLNTRSWRLQFLWPCRSRSLPFLLPWSGITSSSSRRAARTISRKKRSPATVELPDNKKARQFSGGLFHQFRLTVLLLCGCALGHNLSGVFRQLFGLGQLVQSRDHLRIVFRANAQAFFLSKL